MIPSISTDYFDDKSPEEVLELLCGAGWHCLEFANTHTDHMLERDDPVKAAGEFLAMASDRGAHFPQAHLPLAPDLGRDESPERTESIERLKRSLDVHLAVGAKLSIHHAGRLGFMEQAASPKRVWEGRIDAVCQLLDHVKGADIGICLENGAAIGEIEGMLRFIDSCGSPENLAICLDTGHLNVASGRQGDFIRKAGPLLRALHLHDNDRMADQHLLPYAKGGTVRWPEVVPTLREIGFDGAFNFEVAVRNAPLPVRLALLDYIRKLAGIMLSDGAA